MTDASSKWVQPKAAWASRTIWVNVLTLAVAVLMLVSQQTWLPEQTVPILLALVGAINVVLRFLTGQPVQLANPRKSGGDG